MFLLLPPHGSLAFPKSTTAEAGRTEVRVEGAARGIIFGTAEAVPLTQYQAVRSPFRMQIVGVPGSRPLMA
jgi:hypothetical protein